MASPANCTYRANLNHATRYVIINRVDLGTMLHDAFLPYRG